VATHVIGPIFASKADARYAHEIDTQVMCTGLIPEVVAARHCKLLVGAIGVVTMSLAEDKPKEVEAKEVVGKVEDLLRFVIKP
jgi:purine nucleoside phosphorylase